MTFTLADLPDLTGKLAIITGATGGLGYETALALAGAKASVVLTGRNAHKGADALARIRAVHPKSDIVFESLDLARLRAVAEFADSFAARHRTLDILVNNAGVMAYPERTTTPDGMEAQFETNYLGHFALTAHLLPLLAAADRPRTVQLSSGYAQMGRFNFADLNYRSGYRPYTAYAQSKLAMLVFALELQRRSDRAGWGLISTAAHPGYARTDLIANGPGLSGIGVAIGGLVGRFMSQTAAQGALPQIFAAASPDARPAGYYGPDGLFELTGNVKDANMPRAARDIAAASRLWTASEELSGVRFPALASAA